MSELRQGSSWTWEAYLDWEPRQPVRYELVDGRVYAMGGGTAAHDIVSNNLRRELWSQLRGRPCRLHGPDFKVQAGRDGRYPDALVDRAPLVPGALYAQKPTAIFEVLSRSTAWIDQALKLRDYEATPSVRYYALISQDEPRALIYERDDVGRLGHQNAKLLEGKGASIDLPELELVIPFAALYEGAAL